MKYLKQFGIILSFAFAGEALNRILPLPVPGSIYGILLLFLGLCFKIIPLDSVKDAGHFLIEIMPLMFLPAAGGLVDSWGLVRDSYLPFVLICVVTTILVMGTGGLFTQFFIRRSRKKEAVQNERVS